MKRGIRLAMGLLAVSCLAVFRHECHDRAGGNADASLHL